MTNVEHRMMNYEVFANVGFANGDLYFGKTVDGIFPSTFDIRCSEFNIQNDLE